MPTQASFARVGYAALKVETTENTAVKPNTFFPVLKVDIVPKYDPAISSPVSGKRTLNLRSIPNAIAAPTGKIDINVEPKTFGHFLKGCYGTEVVGNYFPITSASGSFTVGETVTGGSSAKTAVVGAVSGENDYLLVSTMSGAFTAGETITGGTSSKTATLGTTSSTVYGHEFSAPQNNLATFTLEVGFVNQVQRFTGVRFNEITLNQKNNIITATITFTARAAFQFGRVTAITTAAAGTKTITVDQTTGLVVGDTIKLYRPSTDAYQDFVSGGVQTHTIASVVTETTFTVTNLQTSTAVGDLIELAPQTPTYSTSNEFSWAGASTVRTSETSMLACVTAAAQNIEDFEVIVQNEIESRHAANGANIVNRFPSANILKGLKGSGKLDQFFVNNLFVDRLRQNRPFSVQVVSTALPIGATTIQYSLDTRMPSAIFNAFNPTISEDGLLDQKMPFTLFDNTTSGYFTKTILVNDVASY